VNGRWFLIDLYFNALTKSEHFRVHFLGYGSFRRFLICVLFDCVLGSVFCVLLSPPNKTLKKMIFLIFLVHHEFLIVRDVFLQTSTNQRLDFGGSYLQEFRTYHLIAGEY